MKKIIALMLAVVMCMCLMVSCGKKEDGGDDAVLKIGGVGPLTGEAAIYGNAVKNGAEIAVAEINANGGIGGRQIEFKFEDDVSDAETSVNAYNSLMDWGMNILVGPVTTGPFIKKEYSLLHLLHLQRM